ncbi:MAG TPA: transglutaminase family protein [Pseudonocardia sp.]|jgi:transglutaminase-like putative cysteine protease
MGWRIRVVHSTGYRYSSSVTQSYNEVRLTPRSDSRQNVIVSRVETVPATRSYRYRDYWGTAVTSFDLHAPHTELEVVATSVVETADPVPVSHEASWAEITGEEVADAHTEMLEFSRYVPADNQLAAIAGQMRRNLRPAEAALATCKWAHDNLRYQAGTTGVHTSAVEAWQAGEGVCQDYAHLTLALLRQLGIPARYISGYLIPHRDVEIKQTVSGESHAWIEVWTGAWWGYDPTNDIEIGQRHVRVALGRDYADVAPLKGIYIGGGAEALEVTVDMTRLA